MLGTLQTRIITSAAASCVSELKKITPVALRARLKKILSAEEGPEKTFAHLHEVALQASVSGSKSAATTSALHSIQSAYHAVLEVWAGTPSADHKQQMMDLLREGLNTRSTARKGTRAKKK